MKKIFPFLEWMPNYNKGMLKGDLSAGLTVGVMLIPQGMAYALIAGLPPVYGLYASIVPLIIYGLMGTSRQLAVGPVAMVSLLVATGVGSIVAPMGLGEVEAVGIYVALAIALALMVGLIQFALGVFRLGFLVNFLSHPVVSGFTSAAALIIGLSQLKHLMGVNIPRGKVHEILGHALEQIGNINATAMLIGLLGIAVILASKKIHKAIPAQLVAVVFGIGIVSIMGWSETVKIVGDIPSDLSLFSIPAQGLSMANLQSLLPIALTIALVGFMESIAVAKAIQAKHRDYKVIPNQELIALGAANIVGSFFKSYPTTGGFSRTAVNDQAGAKTGLASIISAALIVLTILFLTPLFFNLPKAILASVIMVAVFGLIDYKEAIHLWKMDKRDFIMLLTTFVATLALGIEEGIAVGVILSLGMMIFRSARPHFPELGQLGETSHFRNVLRYKELNVREELLVMRFDSQLFFANVAAFTDIIEDKMVEKGDKLEGIIIGAKGIKTVDSSGMHALGSLLEKCQENKIELMFSGTIGPVRDIFANYGFVEKVGRKNFFMKILDAVETFDKWKEGKEIVEDTMALQADD